MRSRPDPEALAVDLLAGHPEPALSASAASPALCRQVVAAATEHLLSDYPPRAERGPGGMSFWPEGTFVSWPVAEAGVVALAQLGEGDGRALAGAFLEAVLRQAQNADPRPATTLWLVKVVPDEIERVLRTSDLGYDPPGSGGIVSALMRLPGEVGHRWFPRVVRAADGILPGLGRVLQTAPDGSAAWAWSPQEWADRLDALADARFETTPNVLTGWWRTDPTLLPPPESSAAQIRCACVYGPDIVEPWVRAVAGHLRAYRTWDPGRDAALVWWAAADSQLGLLRDILEVAGPAGQREPLVAAARAHGLVDAERAAFLSAPLPHPEWAEGEVPWCLAGVRGIGELDIPDGRLAVGDVTDFDDALIVDVVPGRYRVRLVTGEHPLHRRPANAAVDLLAHPHVPVRRWHYMPVPGYWAETGLISADGISAIGGEAAHRHAQEVGFDFIERMSDAEFVQTDEGEAVAFFIEGQDTQCPLYLGLDAAGRTVRLVMTLGVIEADPERDGGVPWDDRDPADAAWTEDAVVARLEAMTKRSETASQAAFAAGAAALRQTRAAGRGDAGGLERSADAHREALFAQGNAAVLAARVADAARRLGMDRLHHEAERENRRHRVLMEEHRLAMYRQVAAARGERPTSSPSVLG